MARLRVTADALNQGQYSYVRFHSALSDLIFKGPSIVFRHTKLHAGDVTLRFCMAEHGDNCFHRHALACIIGILGGWLVFSGYREHRATSVLPLRDRRPCKPLGAFCGMVLAGREPDEMGIAGGMGAVALFEIF